LVTSTSAFILKVKVKVMGSKRLAWVSICIECPLVLLLDRSNQTLYEKLKQCIRLRRLVVIVFAMHLKIA